MREQRQAVVRLVEACVAEPAGAPRGRTDYFPRAVFFGRLGLVGVFFVWACDFGRFFPATSGSFSGLAPWRTLAGKACPSASTRPRRADGRGRAGRSRKQAGWSSDFRNGYFRRCIDFVRKQS